MRSFSTSGLRGFTAAALIASTLTGLGLLVGTAYAQVAPANDLFADAIALTGTSDTLSGTTVNATTETDEPQIDTSKGNFLGHSVWYHVTPTSFGQVTVTVTGSTGYNPAINASSESDAPADFNGLFDVSDDASATDSNGHVGSVSFTAHKDVSYYIQVDGQGPEGAGGENGAFSLAFTEIVAPANDNWETPSALTGASGTVTSSNVGSTVESLEQQPTAAAGDDASSETVWYDWTPTGTGTYRFDTLAAGTTFNTGLAVWTGTEFAELHNVATNDNASSTTVDSEVDFAAAAGTKYSIQVDGFSNGTDPHNGIFVLDWTQTSSTPTDHSSVKISATKTVASGKAITVKGSISDAATKHALGGVTVSLLAKTSGAYRPVGTTTSTSAGLLSLAVKPRTNTTYEWAYAGSSAGSPLHGATTSATASVTVSQVITAKLVKSSVKHGKSATLYGTVSPTKTGLKIVVQEEVGKKWKSTTFKGTVKTQKLGNGKKASGFVITVKEKKTGTHKLRALAARTQSNGAGVSKTVTLTVT